ncbi:MAG: peptide-methionine (S)-S-oxide reductase [Candidatus Ryanbacteria bacterium CG10_big_fil_rev_8_21_14_0_10_43_42]|uniref:Peptide methionine sulfoxide reductase MsrA n=1 Tax=Candidatus Ryanbacteria bacterium CG10_big_fil_rev_8_21_14_0_10_43_42 TaxID=1974864 RepID=A0A2M8KXD3_9BACT|nr:MAG: peptide-methionine (S)-S-oxide reductase [Candidatus Ryanbacteria bacterium CG10_big_fil_rev_8_21_14_0_10_43_42]
MKNNLKIATFGAGCFWGVEAAFRKIKGIEDTAVGYMGGKTENPTYEDVCGNTTGHAEVVQIEYDPEIVSYKELLDVFWKIHNPTTMNRQGPDIGSQYRSVIFFHTPEQEAMACASKHALSESHAYDDPVVTEVVPADVFYRAEEYHQRYFEKNGGGTCHI